MKQFLTVIFFFFSLTVNANFSSYLTCHLDSKLGPIKQFSASFISEERNNFGKISKVNYINVQWVKSLKIEQRVITDKNATFYYKDSSDNEIYFNLMIGRKPQST